MTKHWLIVLMMPVSFLFACNKSNNADNTNELKDSAATSDSMYKPALLLNLPDSMNTPDGLAVNADSSLILLSTPNHNNPSYRSRIYSIAGNSYRFFTDLPLEPTTHYVCTMDLAFGPDGNVYMCDNQFELFDKNYKSGILKVIIKKGRPDNTAINKCCM